MREHSMSPYAVSASVLGMGVAVIASRSAPAPLLLSAARWLTPKRCCSSITTRVSRRNSRSSDMMAVVPNTTHTSPDASPAAASARASASVEPVTSRQVTPASSRSGPIFWAYCAASTDVGAMTAACVPESAAAAMATAATAVLPVPTSPRSRRFITWSDAMSRRMSSAAARCSRVRSNGIAATSARMWGPSTLCEKGVTPRSSSRCLARSASCRHSSSS